MLRAELDCIRDGCLDYVHYREGAGAGGGSALFPQNGFLRSVRNSDIIEK